MELLNDNHSEAKSFYIFGLKRTALIESLLFITVMLAINILFGNGDRFLSIQPHPFWVILLLIVVQYGTYEGIVCTIMMTLAIYVQNLPVMGLSESPYNYLMRIGWLPMQWLLATVILGSLCKRKISLIEELKEQLQLAIKQDQTITTAYNKLNKMNHALETRLASELSSAMQIYKAALVIEDLPSSNRLKSLIDVVDLLIGPEKFSLYTLDQNHLSLQVNKGWDTNEAYQREFNQAHPLFKYIIQYEHPISILTAQGEEVLSNQGMVATALIDPDSKKVFGMLKIEQITFQSLNPRNLQMIYLLAEWLGLSLRKISQLEMARSETLMDRDLQIFTYHFLKEQTNYLVSLARRMKFALTRIDIRLENGDTLSDTDFLTVSRIIGQAIHSALRKVDQIFDEEKRGEHFVILLPGTTIENANIVISKITAFLDSHSENVKQARYNFKADELVSAEGDVH